MSWAVSKNPGRPVSYRVVKPDTILQPGEVLVSENPDGKIWDSALGAMREPNGAETLGEARRSKRDELINAANVDYRAIFTRDGVFIELERDYLLLRKSFGLLLTPLQTNQAQAAQAVVQKLQTRLQTVNAAATEADVLAVVW